MEELKLELCNMGYKEKCAEMAVDINRLAIKWGIGGVEDMKEALMRVDIRRHNLKEGR